MAELSSRDLQMLFVVNALHRGFLPLGRVHEIRVKMNYDKQLGELGFVAHWRPRHDMIAP